MPETTRRQRDDAERPADQGDAVEAIPHGQQPEVPRVAQLVKEFQLVRNEVEP